MAKRGRMGMLSIRQCLQVLCAQETGLGQKRIALSHYQHDIRPSLHAATHVLAVYTEPDTFSTVSAGEVSGTSPLLFILGNVYFLSPPEQLWQHSVAIKNLAFSHQIWLDTCYLHFGFDGSCVVDELLFR
jgi:hypothetical protein